jgi:choline dehydrogenase-like flavoprotein
MEEFDAVIIGSGAGGAPIAYELARAGWSVLVLEKGPRLRTQDDVDGNKLSDFKRDELFGFGTERIITIPGMANTGDSFYPSHVEPDLNDEPHLFSSKVEDKPVVTVEGYTAQVVGGGTQLYGAVSLRFAPDDFRLRSVNREPGRELAGDSQGTALDSVRDWPYSYADLEPYYTKAEKLIGINGSRAGQLKPIHIPDGEGDPYQEPLQANPVSKFALEGMTKLGFRSYRTPLAVITQDHEPSGRKIPRDPQTGVPQPEVAKTSYINRYGDPLGFKSNTWVALLRPTLKEYGDALTLRCNSVVTHLKASGRRIEEVHYRDSSGRAQSVRAKKRVIVACSAIESVRLLMISAEEDRAGLGSLLRYGENNSQLGRYFLTHCFGGAEVAIPAGKYLTDSGGKLTRQWAEFPERRFDKSRSLDSDYATDAPSHPDFITANKLWAGAAIYNNTSDQALPIALARTHGSTDLDALWLGFQHFTDLYGDRMLDWFRTDFGTRTSVSFMANQIPQFDNHIRLHDTVRDKWGRKVAHIVKGWHEHDGYLMDTMARLCEEILLAGVPDINRDNIEEGSVYGNGVRIANHILGGMRFGRDENDSVLDENCKVWGMDNLYVTDGSFMPTSGGANPTLTIQANAFRVADVILERSLLPASPV